MLDELIRQWHDRGTQLLEHARYIEETGLVPNPDVEGAPTDVEEAKAIILGMLATTRDILQDLNLLRIQQGLEAVRSAEN